MVANRGPDQTGRGDAAQRWVPGALIVAILALTGAALWPVRAGDPTRPIAVCLDNLRRASGAFAAYSADNDDRLPPAESWMDRVAPFGPAPESMRCPVVTERNREGYGYAMNARASGRSNSTFDRPSITALAFESTDLARSAVGSLADMPDPMRHDGRSCVLFVDGHVKALFAAEVSTLRP